MKLFLEMLLYRAFHAQRKRLRPFMAQLKLAPGQPKILYYLVSHEGCMQKEVAEYCDIEPATASRILDTMEKGGLIRRTVAENNRRAGSISLTETGLRQYQLWETRCREVEAEMLAGFSEKEKRELTEYLKRVYKNLSGKDAL